MRIGVLLLLAVITSPPCVYATQIYVDSSLTQPSATALGPDPGDIIKVGCDHAGDPCTMTIPSLSNNTSGWSYYWSVTGPTPVFGSTTPTFNPTFGAPGYYTVTVKVSNPSGDATKTRVLAVAARSCASHPTDSNTSIGFVGSGPSNCIGSASTCSVGETITFQVSPYGWAFADCDRFTWDFGDGTTSNVKSPTKTYSSPGAYTVRVKVEGGLSTANVQTSFTVGAICSSNPTDSNTSISFIGRTTKCFPLGSPCSPDENINFSISPYGWVFGECDKFTWDFGDGSTSTLKSPTKAYRSVGAYTVRVKVEGGQSIANVSRMLNVGTTCPPMYANANVYISFMGSQSGCRYQVGHCMSTEQINFSASTFGGYTFGCAAHSFQWDFGDGSTSSVQNPVKSYSQGGTYTVTLTITSPTNTATISQPITIGAGTTAPIALFSFTPAWPRVGQEVQFTDASIGNPTQWVWNFEGGAASGAQHPTHIFRSPGRYLVTLTASNSSGANSKSEMLAVSELPIPVAAFSFLPIEPGVGDEIRFSDDSSGGASLWAWDFGDGATSSVQHPTHAFHTDGRKTVKLTVSNENGSSSAAKEVFVTPASQLRMLITPTAPATEESVRFSVMAAGRVSEHQWEFGDGSRSSSPTPLHVFTAPGEYKCSLLAFVDGSPVVASKTITVRSAHQAPVADFVTAPPVLMANVPVEFIDTSSGGTTSWIWSFGDGTTATGRTVSHIFAVAGSYTVKLITANRYGASSAQKTLSVAGTSKRRATRR